MRVIMRLCFVLSLVFFMACKGPHDKSEKIATDTKVASEKKDSSKTMQEDNTHDEAKTGTGPIKEKVELGNQIDKAMADKGEKLFKNHCSTCHRIKESAVGPALGGVLDERSPQWVMNMILNPGGMIENNVQVQAMKSQYETRMVDLNLSKDEARQIVEYLRNY